MVNLVSMDDSGYTRYRKITDSDVLDLQCSFVTSLLHRVYSYSKESLLLKRQILYQLTRIEKGDKHENGKVAFRELP